MRYATNSTPLLELLRALETDERRQEFAELAGTKVPYLYQLATCKRGACRSDLAKAIEDASRMLHDKHETPVVTMAQLATMCPVSQ